MKYRWVENEKVSPIFWKCQIYIDNNGQEEILGNYETTYSSEFPNTFCKSRKDFDFEKIPEKYINDFRMVWKQAHDEQVKLQEEDDLRRNKAWDDFEKSINELKNPTYTDEDKVILKQFYRVLANTYHPDNKKTGNAEMMKHLNDLKAVWGI